MKKKKSVQKTSAKVKPKIKALGSKDLPKAVSEAKFRRAIADFRKKEKKNTRERDKLNAERRRLPMMEVKNDYVFDTADGKKSLLDLFEGRRQLLLYHFMYHPKTDSFCKGCSFVGDQIPHLAHLHARNTSFTLCSQAPLKSIQRHEKKMEWDLPWVSSLKNSLNDDFGIDGNVHHELSVLIRDGEKIYRTYYTSNRGVEYLGTPWAFLDVTPWGRQELWEDSPNGWPQSNPYEWWNFHDEY